MRNYIDENLTIAEILDIEQLTELDLLIAQQQCENNLEVEFLVEDYYYNQNGQKVVILD